MSHTFKVLQLQRAESRMFWNAARQRRRVAVPKIVPPRARGMMVAGTEPARREKGTTRMYLRSIGLLALLLAVAPGCVWLSGNRVAVYEVADARLQGAESIEQVRKGIQRAAQIQGWDLQEVESRRLYATKTRGQHSATAVIRYRRDAFSIELRASENLKQANGRIHKLYNEWVRALEESIQIEVIATP